MYKVDYVYYEMTTTHKRAAQRRGLATTSGVKVLPLDGILDHRIFQRTRFYLWFSQN